MTDKIYRGWAEQVRTLSKVIFVELYLGGSPDKKLQVVISGSKSEIKSLKLSRHCALELAGTEVISLGSEQETEIQTSVDRVTILGYCDQDEYPIAKKDLGMAYLRSVPMWRGRTKIFRAAGTISSLVSHAIHKYFRKKGYIHIHTPLITKSDCEGAGEAFKVVTEGCEDFFGVEEDKNIDAFLTVSGQLQGEVIAASYGPVYTFGPTFRAEKSKTSRHLSEFWMIEPEIPFMKLEGLINLSIDMLKYIVTYIIRKGRSSLEVLDGHSPGLIEKLDKFLTNAPVIMSYTEAIDRLANSGVTFSETPEWGIDLSSDHETWLCGDNLTILTDYPCSIKAFYMYESEDCGPGRETVACMDVLLPGIGEVIGGSQRESRLNILEPKMVKLGLDGPQYDFYRDLRKFGYSGSSGFGMGFERIVRYVTGLSQIRDVIPFPVSYGKIHT